MSTPPSSVARPGQVLHGSFPLLWEACVDELTEQARNIIDEANETTLRNYLLLDSRSHDALDDRDEATPEIQRLEQRLNLVIDLLAQVLSRDLQLPQPVACEISRDAVEWAGESLPVPGTRIKLSVYLNPHYPRPLILFGSVEHAAEKAQTQYARMTVHDMAEPVGEWLDRLIFRDHRRRVAQTKRGK